MVLCDACWKREEELGGGLMMQRCAQCYGAFYCNAECQLAHWVEHRARCKERAAAMAAAKATPLSVGDASGLNAAALRRARDAGDAVAMTKLGICYDLGMGGVLVDAAEAARWYTRATEARDPPAEAYCNLANYYNRGEGVHQNLSEAARLYQIAAEMGDAPAQYYFGLCLQLGEGVDYNPVESFTWLKRAADTGYAAAQCYVGLLLQSGLGVPADAAAAFMYYRRSAEQGHAVGMSYLGRCYESGDGVPPDLPQAVAWFSRARDAGDPDAEKELAKIAPRLTPAQRAAAGELLAAPLPRQPVSAIPTGAGGGPGRGAGGAGAPPVTRADILTMGTGALKRMLQGRGVDTSGIHVKAHLIELALAAIGEAPQ